MTNRMTPRLGWAAILLALAAILCVLTAAYGFRQGWWPVLRALDIAEWGVWSAVAGALAAIVGLVIWPLRGARDRARSAKRGTGTAWPAAVGLILTLPVLVMAGGWQYATVTSAPINDVSTDVQDPPVFWFTKTPSDYPPANAATQQAAYPDVRPLSLPLDSDAAFDAILALIADRGWEVLSDDRSEGQVEAVATSPLFGFQDEVAIRVTPTESGTQIDMRSRSRIGQIDRGANARRIKAFLADLRDMAESGSATGR